MKNIFIELKKSHLNEWVEGSGVSEAIARLNLRSITDPKLISELLNWSAYRGSPGWFVNSVDLETGQLRRFGQFKPDTPIQFPNSQKPCKYISFPKGDGIEVILLLPDMDTWEKIADKYSVAIAPEDIDESRLDKGFWRWVQDNPQLPIAVTEGAKKAGCLLHNGYITICLTGVWNGKQKGKLKAIPTLAPFLVKGRPIHLVFDSDIVVKKQVQSALMTTGYLATKAGCITTVALWEYTEVTKGVDDLIVNQGIEVFEEIMENIMPFKEWLQTIEKQFETDTGGLVRLDSRRLVKYLRANYRDRLRLNKVKQRIELDGKEILLETAYLDLAEFDGIECSKNKAADAFERIAKENAYSPVENYLDTVAREIAPIDLDNLSVRYFGVNNSIYNKFLKRTLLAAVARTYEPGCKNDTALVLQGDQGVGKSTFFSILGGDWFGDSMGSGKNKDDLMVMHRSWIQELGEIDRIFSKKQAGEIKALLSCSNDTFRPPYGRSAMEFPRRSIIVGTVNDAQFLVDPTGNRRFWVIPVKKKIDLEMLRRERDGIWAAAVHAYRNGEPWWLTPEEEAMCAENNQTFEIVDEWQSAIANYLSSKTQVSITELLMQVFGFELGQIQRRDQMRVANILTALNWKKAGQRQSQGKRRVIWEPKPFVAKEAVQPEISSQQKVSEAKQDSAQTAVFAQDNKQLQPTVKHIDKQQQQRLFGQITKEVKKLGWNKKQAIAAIKQRYGASDRGLMSVEQLVDFRDFLAKGGKDDSQDDKSGISVGDRVTVDDCPGHWAWASPFTVEAIEGNFAKLEMVTELVGIDRLSRE